jgi:hypothetical protein
MRCDKNGKLSSNGCVSQLLDWDRYERAQKKDKSYVELLIWSISLLSFNCFQCYGGTKVALIDSLMFMVQHSRLTSDCICTEVTFAVLTISSSTWVETQAAKAAGGGGGDSAAFNCFAAQNLEIFKRKFSSLCLTISRSKINYVTATDCKLDVRISIPGRG